MTPENNELFCRDIGWDCDFLACGKTEEEAISKLGQHVLDIHGIEGFSKEFYNKARSAILKGDCEYSDDKEIILEDCSACYESCYNCTDECCF